MVSNTYLNNRSDNNMDNVESASILSKFRKRLLNKELPLEYIIIALTFFAAVLFIVFVDGFARLGNLEIIARNSAALTVLSCGMAIVIITRGLDLSQVAIMVSVAAVFGILIINGHGYGTALMAAFSLAILLGALNGFLIAYIEIPPLLTTLATAMLITGLSRWGIMRGEFLVLLPKDAPIIGFLSTGRLFSIPVPIIISIVVLCISYFLLNKTVFGKMLYAMGENSEAARLTGLPVRLATVAAYAFSAATAMIAGIVIASSSGTVDYRIVTNGTLLFEVIMVVVLGGVSLRGGRGSVFSIIVGLLLISILRNGMTLMNLSSQVQGLIKGLVLISAIVIDNYYNPRDTETDTQGDL